MIPVCIQSSGLHGPAEDHEGSLHSLRHAVPMAGILYGCVFLAWFVCVKATKVLEDQSDQFVPALPKRSDASPCVPRLDERLEFIIGQHVEGRRQSRTHGIQLHALFNVALQQFSVDSQMATSLVLRSK